MLNLNLGEPHTREIKNNEDRARSSEILDSKTAHLRAPENTLMAKHQENRQPSEHELRIQKSLTKLDVPEWYRKFSDGGKSPAPSTKRELGSGLAGGWSGLSSKASSLTSLQHNTGRFTSGENRLSSRRILATGTSSAGGRCGGSVTSPNSTTSVSPSPYYERSSFTSYGMPYAMTRFGTGRMTYGASPASLSPSPSPVAGMGSAMSTPTASGPSTRLHGYTKQPYLGWRSQERLASNNMYRTPPERLAADLMKVQSPKSDTVASGETSKESSIGNLQISPNVETASNLSLNNNEESTRHKLNRVRSSIKAVSNAIVDYVNESRPLDDGVNGRSSPRPGVWLESSFVGTKPIDSTTSPDTSGFSHKVQGSITKKTLLKPITADQSKPPSSSPSPSPSFGNALSQHHQSMFSRNEQLEERYSNSSSVSSPTLDDILDSLLALRRPHKKFKSRDKGHVTSSFSPPLTTSVVTATTSVTGTPSSTPSPARTIAKIESSFLTNPAATVGFGMGLILPPQSTPVTITPSPISDWHMRMLQPVQDAAEFIFPDDSIETLLKNEEREMLSIPTDPTRAFNISPETNIGAHVDSIAEEVDGLHFKLGAGKPNQFGALVETSLPSSPAKNRRVSFDLDLDDREEKSSSRSRKDSDSVGGSVIECRNSKCGKSGVGLEARREFKTCHNCNAYYCSRECRRAHWEKHKKVCMQSRVGALCKQIIAQIRDDTEIVAHLSRQSRQGYLAKGRGCIKLFFSSPDRAERFLTGGFPEIAAPWYIASSDILPEEMGAQVYAELSEQCQTYNPATRFIIYVSLCVVNEVPTSGAVKWEREMISRSAKLRLFLPRGVEEESPHHQVAAHLHHVGDDVYFLDSVPPPFLAEEYLASHLPSDGETIILRSVPLSSKQLSPDDQRRMREVSFTNIQRHLNERGVKLRRTYPEIYSRLCDYIEKDEPFLPVTIHPRNSITGKLFTCIIMPECSDSTLSADGNNQVIDISTPTTNNSTS